MAKNRDSNFELLRVISMFMVLGLHANFIALSEPSAEYIGANPIGAFLRYSNEALCIVAVNVFVLISGWFGIRPTMRKLTTLLFQCLFFSLSLIAVVAFTDTSLRFSMVMKCIEMRDYWFIISYIALFIISPVLNAFTDSASRTTFKRVIIALLLMQSIYGWCFNDLAGYNRGYSIISFIELYLIARYVRTYSPKIFCRSFGGNFAIYVTLSLLIGSISFGVKAISGIEAENQFYYCSPLVVAASLYLLIAFSKLSFHCRFVNFAAPSALAAYLLHQHLFVFPLFLNFSAQLYHKYELPLYAVAIVTFLSGVYLAGMALDQLRKWIFAFLSRQYIKINENKAI